jgi:hypothetical protein
MKNSSEKPHIRTSIAMDGKIGSTPPKMINFEAQSHYGCSSYHKGVPEDRKKGSAKTSSEVN